MQKVPWSSSSAPQSLKHSRWHCGCTSTLRHSRVLPIGCNGSALHSVKFYTFSVRALSRAGQNFMASCYLDKDISVDSKAKRSWMECLYYLVIVSDSYHFCIRRELSRHQGLYSICTRGNTANFLRQLCSAHPWWEMTTSWLHSCSSFQLNKAVWIIWIHYYIVYKLIS